MYTLLGIVLLVLLLYIACRFWQWLSIGKVVTRDVAIANMDSYFQDYMRRGNEGSIIVFEHPVSKAFVQFRKRLDLNGKIDMKFGFPDALWSRDYFPSLEKAFSREGIKYNRTSTRTPEVPKFIEVSCGSDVGKAIWIARIALIEIMGLSEQDLVNVSFQGGGDPKSGEVIGKR